MEALVFTIYSLGFLPRCSKEIDDGGVRITKIVEIIKQCKYGFHDVSRVQLDKKTKLPRFNMPLELGIDLACKAFFRKDKVLKIADKKLYRFREYISDISGQDISGHNNGQVKLIRIVRNWLKTNSKIPLLPSDETIIKQYRRFRRHLPKIYAAHNFKKEIPYVDYCEIVFTWLKTQQVVATRR